MDDVTKHASMSELAFISLEYSESIATTNADAITYTHNLFGRVVVPARITQLMISNNSKCSGMVKYPRTDLRMAPPRI